MFLDFIKFAVKAVMIIALILTLALALPTIVEKATSDKPEYPHSGFSPECPTWEAPDEDLFEIKREILRNRNLK